MLVATVLAAAGTGLQLAAGTPGIFGAPCADEKACFAAYDQSGGGDEPTSSARPSPRGYHAMTYDAESDRVILFGGQSNSASGLPDLSDTWAFGLGAWANQLPASSPAAGALTMVYHTPSDRAVVLKGMPTTGHLDAWAYSYNSNSWTVQVSSAAPAGRNGWRIAYDAQSDRIILFGGILGGIRQNDTWAFDYANNTWTEMTPIASPPARNWHRMVYDARGDRIVLFGGSVADNGTWAYDYESNTWSSLGSEGAPPPRIYHDMVYDTQSDRIILFGGVDYPSEVPHNDMWTYDLGTRVWTKLATSLAPSPRGWHAMAVADRSRQVVLFGGGPDRNHFTQETWSYDVGSSTWALVDAPAPPVASFSFTPSSPTVSQTMTLDASMSSDPDGTIASYAWEFGDGSTASGAIVQHAYTNEGMYSVTLTVTDNEGLRDSATEQVVVLAPLVVSLSADSTSGTIPFTVSFTAAPSGGVPPYSFAWDFGDNSFGNYSSSTAQNPTHTYEFAGTYDVSVTVTDAIGQTASMSTQVTAKAPNAPAVITGVTSAPISAILGQEVTWTATISDPDGDSLAYRWDFGDGTNATGMTPPGGGTITATHSYAATGTYTVTLSVDDGKGGKAATLATVHVTSPGLPLWALYALVAAVAVGIGGVVLWRWRDRIRTPPPPPGSS